VQRHERISALARRLSEPPPSQEAGASTQRQLDLEVYALYGLNEAQRATVDAVTRGD